MMMEVEPGERRDFDIRERRRLSPDRGYSFLLKVEEPEELFVSERRDCLVVEDDPRGVVWEYIGSTQSGEVVPAGSAKEALPSSFSRSIERDREVADFSEDLESKEDQSSDSSSEDDLKAEEEIATEGEVETDRQDDEAVGGGRYVASTTSNKYHRADCRYAEKIKKENRIYFSDAWEAREAGYSPCKVCNPE